MRCVARAAQKTSSLLDPYLLNGKLLHGGGGHGGFIGQGVVVVGLAQVQTGIVQRLALREVVIIRVQQERRAHPTNQRFGEPMKDVEGGEISRA